MNEQPDNFSDIDERVERLISRSLDGEIRPEERVELDAILARDSAARAMYDDYRRNDVLAGAALRHEFAGVPTAVMARPRRGLWLATAGAVLSMAAVVALSFIPSIRTLFSGSGGGSVVENSRSKQGPVPMIGNPTYVDYQGNGMTPMRRDRDIRRELIGVRGPNDNVIYIFERNAKSTRESPISGDL